MKRGAYGGFTLIEMVVSMVVLGIIGSVVSSLIQLPVQGYFDSKERAQLSDGADNALRRMAREIRLAVPNSVRLTSASGLTYLEFLLSTGGGRYRVMPTGAGAGNPLLFGTAITAFDALGPLPNSTGAAWVIVGNVSATDSSQPNAYLAPGGAMSSRAACTVCSASTITFPSTTTFPTAAEFESRQYFLSSGAVTYICDPANGVLRRYSGYPITAAQPTPGAGTGTAVLTGLSACTMFYGAVNQDIGVVSLRIDFATSNDAGAISSQDEARLVHHVSVSNAP